MAKRPNVLVFFTDQQRWDTVGVHGNPLDVTPNFDRLAASGSFVKHSFTCQPVCGPARSAFQTGRYPTSTGCFINGIALPEEQKTLAHHFKGAGYDTGYIGKWHLADHDPVPASQQGGYDHWMGANILEFESWPYETKLYDRDGEAHKLPGYRIDALADEAIRYVSEERDNPYFLFLSFLEPHHQNQHDNYPAPVGYAERLARKGVELPPDLAALGGTSEDHYFGYMGMVARLDEALGRIVDALISLDQLDNTIILFTSDHGCHFKTRNAEYKRSCHDASIRVPSLFHGPGFMGGTPITRKVSLIDLPPTLLDAAGIDVPDEMQGHSIQSSQSVGSDIFVQISESQTGRALRTDRWKYSVEAPETDLSRDAGSDRYVEAHLYDLENDPWELDNLVASVAHAQVRRELSERLIKRMVQAGEPVPEILEATG